MLGRTFGRWLAHPALQRLRLYRELDQRLNLRYLAQRLQYEALEIAAEGAAPSRLRFSIITPTWGIHLKYFEALLESLQRQTHTHWELCVCDDGDLCPDIFQTMSALQRREPERYRLVRHARNLGITLATRSSLALATGELLTFVDADDVLHPRALELIAARFDRDDDVDFVYTDHDYMTDWGHRMHPMRKPAWSPELLTSVNYINHLVAVRRSCFERCEQPFSDETNGSQDWDLCLKLGRTARRVAHVPIVLYHWRARPGSMATSAACKPWAVEAAHRVLSAHAASIDPRLELCAPFTRDAAVALKPGTPAPPLHLVELDAGDGEPAAPPAWRGALERLRVAASRRDPSLPELARAIDGRLAALPPDALVLFQVRGCPPLSGELERMASYAIQHNVGGVWPFRDPIVRCAYTLDPRGRLEPLRWVRGPFSSFSGNILTGPLHGLMARAGTLLDGGGLAATAAGARSVQALGARFGLTALERGRRNVAARGAFCDYVPPPLELESPFEVDPYL
jgi:hypothetical protein